MQKKFLKEKKYLKSTVCLVIIKMQAVVRIGKKELKSKYCVPPLNGTAHTWHHFPATLINIIHNGSIEAGVSMPSFKKKLTNKEENIVLKYIFSFWPEEIKTTYTNKYGDI